MNVSLFLKSAALCIAAALIAFAFYGTDLLFLAKGIALALGASIVLAVVYPHLRSIRRGDRVSLVKNNMPAILFGKAGFALNDSALHREVRVKLDDGKEAIGIVESYESVLSPPKVRIVYEETIMER